MVTIRLEALGARYGKSLRRRDVTTPAFESGDIVAGDRSECRRQVDALRRIAGFCTDREQYMSRGAFARNSRICYMPQDTSANAVLNVYESVLLARKQGWAGP